MWICDDADRERRMRERNVDCKVIFIFIHKYLKRALLNATSS